VKLAASSTPRGPSLDELYIPRDPPASSFPPSSRGRDELLLLLLPCPSRPLLLLPPLKTLDSLRGVDSVLLLRRWSVAVLILSDELLSSVVLRLLAIEFASEPLRVVFRFLLKVSLSPDRPHLVLGSSSKSPATDMASVMMDGVQHKQSCDGGEHGEEEEGRGKTGREAVL
jgi:hypothetical protein